MFKTARDDGSSLKLIGIEIKWEPAIRRKVDLTARLNKWPIAFTVTVTLQLNIVSNVSIHSLPILDLY